MDEQERRERLAALRWQVEAGADEALAAALVDRLSAPAAAAVAHSPVAVPQPAAMEPTAAGPTGPTGRAGALGGGADPNFGPRFDRDASPGTGQGAGCRAGGRNGGGGGAGPTGLRAALAAFDGCGLKKPPAIWSSPTAIRRPI